MEFHVGVDGGVFGLEEDGEGLEDGCGAGTVVVGWGRKGCENDCKQLLAALERESETNAIG